MPKEALVISFFIVAFFVAIFIIVRKNEVDRKKIEEAWEKARVDEILSHQSEWGKEMCNYNIKLVLVILTKWLGYRWVNLLALTIKKLLRNGKSLDGYMEFHARELFIFGLRTGRLQR